MEREHNTESRDCWCAPSIYAPCPEDCGNGCWKCKDSGYLGMVRVSKDYPMEVVIVHRDFLEEE